MNSFQRGYRDGLREAYSLLNSLLNEGMDIHAFKKISNDVEFQKACEIYSSRIKNDDDAKAKFSLSNLNDFKENPEVFIKAVQDAVEYIESRKNEKSIRKARKQKGVEIVYEDEKCIITMPDGPKYARAAGSLIESENSCPWCVANAYPDNKRFWERYKAYVLLFIYKKQGGKPVDAWCMVLTRDNVQGFLEDADVNKPFFTILESIENKGDGDVQNQGLKRYKRMLYQVGLVSSRFRKIIHPVISEAYKSVLKERMTTQLRYAIARGQYEKVVDVLNRGADVNCELDGWTPLMFAVIEENVEIVELLIRRGADVNALREDGDSPLGLAARGGNIKFCEILLRHGADIDGKEGCTPALVTAMQNRTNFGVVKFLLERGADVNAKDADGWSPLRWAVSLGKGVICRMLLEHGADVEIRDNDGHTPLYFAALEHHIDICKILLEHGADANSRDNFGQPVLNGFIRQTTGDNVEVCEILLKHGADVNARGGRAGRAPLVCAIEAGKRNILEFLLKNGANVNAKVDDVHGNTPLIVSTTRSNVEICEVLLDNGAVIDAQNNYGETALIVSALCGHGSICLFLLERGADVNVRDDYGETPLIAACKSQHRSSQVCKKLIEKGVDVNAKNESGATALDYVRYKDNEIVKILKSAGAV